MVTPNILQMRKIKVLQRVLQQAEQSIDMEMVEYVISVLEVTAI